MPTKPRTAEADDFQRARRPEQKEQRREEILANAPRTARGFFVVPKVVE